MSASDGSGQRILLIDGHAMAFRAFFALPADGFSDGRGQATNAVYGFTRMIINVVASEEPTHVAVAFDLPGGTFRDRIYDQYKAGREVTPPEFVGQIALIQQVLDALGGSRGSPWRTTRPTTSSPPSRHAPRPTGGRR